MLICLLTPGQPSTNPRLLKEADALSEAGYGVQVICARWADWADKTDSALLRGRNWACRYVEGERQATPFRYQFTRIRHGLARRLVGRGLVSGAWRRWALCRVLPELERVARDTPADLYVAHNLGALPAAFSAARRHGALVGFDAEDFHSGQSSNGAKGQLRAVEATESEYLPRCDYVTASSPQIAGAYADKYKIPEPTTILNSFPLSQRPPRLELSPRGRPLTLYWFSQTLGPNRGLEDVIEAMAMLGDSKIELHLRGSCRESWRVALQKLSASLGLSRDQIVFHAPAPPEEMVSLASRFDVGLALEPGFDCNNDLALSNKLFAYLLAGNAIVATTTRAQSLFLARMGPAARLLESGNIPQLAQALRSWVEQPEALARARQTAWHWGETYNWDREKRVFLRLIERALSGDPGRAPGRRRLERSPVLEPMKARRTTGEF